MSSLSLNLLLCKIPYLVFLESWRVEEVSHSTFFRQETVAKNYLLHVLQYFACYFFDFELTADGEAFQLHTNDI